MLWFYAMFVILMLFAGQPTIEGALFLITFWKIGKESYLPWIETCKHTLAGRESRSCEEGWEENGKHCFYWSTENKTSNDAEDFCWNRSGHLASVTTNYTNNYIKNKLGLMRTLKLTLTNALWIGGTDEEEEEVWKWTDSSPWGFSDWLNNEPNNFGFWDGQDCLAYSNMPGDRYKWRDHSCGRVFMF